ncbi:MAG TPA: pilin [Patescibacteria group bacterium]|nr:pilin [Patescibacteria group bacterium]
MNFLSIPNWIVSASAAPCMPSGGSLCNPLQGGVNVPDVPTLLTHVLNDLGGVIGLVAIAMVVYAGFRMVTANGEQHSIDKAKQILKYSVYGFVASVMAYAAVVAVENFIGVQDPNYDSSQPQNPLQQFGNLKVFTEQMIQNILLVIGAVSLLMIIINGFRYMTARGNDEQVSTARRALTWAIAGLAISLFAYTIVSAVAKLIS